MSITFKEQYLNLIELLKNALEFYAKEDNYVENEFSGTDAFSLVELDKGKQARSVLEHIDKVLKMTEEFENDYENIIKAAESEQADPKKLLEELKRFKDEY